MIPVEQRVVAFASWRVSTLLANGVKPVVRAAALSSLEVVRDQAGRHQYQRRRFEYPCCRETTCAELSAWVPSGQSGPRLTAFFGLLMACVRQSERRAALFLEAILGQLCSAGLTVKLQNRVPDALRPAADELCEQLPSQPVLNIDETLTKEGANKSWLWTFVARRFTVYRARPTRAASVLNELLTDRFAGVVGCDQAKMYWRLKRLQWCWAHLLRDFRNLIDTGPPATK